MAKSKSKFTLAATLNNAYAEFSDSDIEKMFIEAKRAFNAAVDANESDEVIDALEIIEIRLDEELAARGL